MANSRTLLGAAAMLLGLASLFASLLAHGGRWSERLDVASHFALPYTLAAAAALVLGTVAPAGRFRVVVTLTAVAGLLASGALIAPALLDPKGPSPRPGARTFKVVQFNVWGRNAMGVAAARWILDQSPDVVILEEGGGLNSILTKYYHPSCVSCAVTVFTRRRPKWIDPHDRHHTSHPYLTAAALDDPEGEIVVVGVHRAWPNRFDRTQQDRADLADFLSGRDQRRVILAGDFNATPWSFERRREELRYDLIRRTRALPSWPAARLSHNRLPAPFPYLPIDHVYAGPGWATVKVELGPRLGSDHYPVVVTLAPVESGVK